MILAVDKQSYVVFDLDDTLYPEIDFVRSGFRHISRVLESLIGHPVDEAMFGRFQAHQEVFGWLFETMNLPPEWSVERLLDEYRRHSPALALPGASARLLDTLSARGVPLGLITDGRSISQRNKINALGLDGRFSDVVISEEFGSGKPDPRNFEFFEHRNPGRSFTIIADNPVKDFQVPSRLGWVTICLKGCATNVHPQDLEREPRPGHVVGSLDEIVVSGSAY